MQNKYTADNKDASVAIVPSLLSWCPSVWHRMVYMNQT